ncbi:MAG TPA: septal ring lytic transglycosylase RlpA family protein [Candidatus Limnocylindrales bacterium]|nr:septal ring lytic transglycosylase RlpA family protein [Candidatus Limnocylindrales bacterium]
MRPDRVVAGIALMVILALVAVPGAAGHQTPAMPTVPSDAFRPVVLDAAPGTAIPALDLANRSASALDAATTLVEPAVRPSSSPRRVAPPAVRAAGGSVYVPPPAPPRVASSGSGGSSGSGSSGGWRTSGSSWYGPGFYGSGTACGQTLTSTLVGVAHKTLPCGTLVEFRNPSTGKVVSARGVDRGPYVSGRDWDLTVGLCKLLDHCYTAPIQWRLP